MKSRFIIFLMFLLLMCVSLMAQEPIDADITKAQINRLKEGTLLIKLNTQSVRIDHKLKSGQKKQAQKLIEEVNKEHSQIINGFKNHYTYSDYYFFLSDDSDEVILEKNYKPLFKNKTDKSEIVNSLKNPFLIILGIPPGYSSVDKYKFILHELGDDGITPIHKPMPKVYKTQTKKLFSNKYDFDRAVELLQERLIKYEEKVHSAK